MYNNSGGTESYTIIVEQNLEYIPEFPSNLILVFILLVSLTIVITKNVWRQVE